MNLIVCLGIYVCAPYLLLLDSLQVLIIIFDSNILSFSEFLLMLSNKLRVDLELRGLGVFTEEDQVGLVSQTASEPEEWLLEVVVGSGREIIVLKVSLSVELDITSLNLSVLNIDLVTNEDDRNILTNTDNVSMPVGNILVSDSRCDIEHNDGTLTLDIITITETSKLLLTSGIPHVKTDLPAVRVELQWMHLNTQGWDVLLLELTGSVSLNQGCFTNTSVTDEQQLEFRNTRHKWMENYTNTVDNEEFEHISRMWLYKLISNTGGKQGQEKFVSEQIGGIFLLGLSSIITVFESKVDCTSTTCAQRYPVFPSLHRESWYLSP